MKQHVLHLKQTCCLNAPSCFYIVSDVYVRVCGWSSWFYF